VITQGVNDFYDVMGRTGQALLENSDYLFLLMQKSESLLSLKKHERLVLGKSEFDLLNSVHRGDGYSEVYFFAPTGRGIGRLVVPRETQLRYTTNSDEVAKIERLEREGKTTEEAIAHLVEQERVAAAKRGVKQVA
jgi:conjugal transfer ATP-binding protein TraC